MSLASVFPCWISATIHQHVKVLTQMVTVTHPVGVQPLGALDDGLVGEAQLVRGLDQPHAVLAHLQQYLLDVHALQTFFFDLAKNMV